MKRGFTLVEVLVVIAILGITAAAVVPALANATAEDDLTRATRIVSDVFDAARTRALEGAMSVTVTFVPEAKRYWMRTGEETLDSGVFALDPGVRLQSPIPRPAYRFDPLGTVDGDSVILVGALGARTLSLDRWTGTIHAPAR